MNISEKEEINKLKSSITTNTKGGSAKSDKSNFNEKRYCKAAVKLPGVPKAFKCIEDGYQVGLISEEINGIIKKIPYKNCLLTRGEGCDYCKKHLPLVNSPSFKCFDKDILPRSKNDKDREMLTAKSEYFQKYKKNTEINFIEHILRNGTKSEKEKLNKYAENLIKSKKSNEKDEEEDEEEDNLEEKSGHLKAEMVATTKTVTKATTKATKKASNTPVEKTQNNQIPQENNGKLNQVDQENIEENIDDNESVNSISFDNDQSLSNDLINESLSAIASNNIESDNDTINADVESSSEDSELEADDEITANNGETFYLIDDKVYKPDDEDGGCRKFGILMEIQEKYHTVKYDNKFYTICRKLNDEKTKKFNMYLCRITNNLFDKNLKLIGHAFYDKNNVLKYEYKIREQK